ncbi:MAG: hypothetical protein IT538_03470 [Variibacter sp.]|nr:hypothetical protein [Variibacter sp.]
MIIPIAAKSLLMSIGSCGYGLVLRQRDASQRRLAGPLVEGLRERRAAYQFTRLVYNLCQ